MPQSKSELRSFLQLASYYRRFINEFAKIEAQLHAQTSPNTGFSWSKTLSFAFKNLKIALTSPPVLTQPDFSKPFIVETDASLLAVRAYLAQKDDEGRFHYVQCASPTMNFAEKNCTVSVKEALAVVFALKRFRNYLISRETLTHITDHQALCFAFKEKDIHGRLARWLEFLAEYRFEIVYRSGNSNLPADYLSKQRCNDQESPVISVGDDLKEIYKVELVAMFNISKPIETKAVSPKIVNCVKRNIKNFVLWDDHMFRCTAYGLIAIAPMQ